MGAKWIENTYAQGMYHPYRQEQKFCPEDKSFFCCQTHPWSGRNNKKLIDLFKQDPAEVISVYSGQREPAADFQSIMPENLREEPAGGLKTLLNQAENIRLLNTGDEGILKDLDRKTLSPDAAPCCCRLSYKQ